MLPAVFIGNLTSGINGAYSDLQRKDGDLVSKIKGEDLSQIDSYINTISSGTRSGDLPDAIKKLVLVI